MDGSISQFDPRRYVAYLVADGNDMGQVFDRCDEDQMRRLSRSLTRVLRESLAEVCAELLKNQEKVAQSKEQILPVLPLIMGGDDL